MNAWRSPRLGYVSLGVVAAWVLFMVAVVIVDWIV